MKLSEMHNGLLVAVREDIDLFSEGIIIRKGETGTVHSVSRDSKDRIVAFVVLHKHFPQLDEWSNELSVYREFDGSGTDCTPEKFDDAYSLPVVQRD